MQSVFLPRPFLSPDSDPTPHRHRHHVHSHHPTTRLRLAVPPSDSASAASAILVITEAGLAEIAAALPVQVNPFLVTAGVRAEGGLRQERPLSQRPIAPPPAHPAHGVTVRGARNTTASCSGRVGMPSSSSTSDSVFSPGATPTPHNANDRRAELSRRPIAPRQPAFSPPPPPLPIKRRVPPKEVNSEVSVQAPKRVKECKTSRETIKLCKSACLVQSTVPAIDGQTFSPLSTPTETARSSDRPCATRSTP